MLEVEFELTDTDGSALWDEKETGDHITDEEWRSLIKWRNSNIKVSVFHPYCKQLSIFP